MGRDPNFDQDCYSLGRERALLWPLEETGRKEQATKSMKRTKMTSFSLYCQERGGKCGK